MIKRLHHVSRFTLHVSWLLACAASASLAPYSTDVSTLHLWHVDEATAPCADSVAGGTNLTTLANGATLNNASFTGFGSALSTVDGGTAGGNSAASIDAALSPLPLANGASDNVSLSFADPATGAFTFEAMIWIGFDPTANLGTGGSGRNLPMQIISGEQDGTGGGVRAWQFRLDPTGLNPNADGYTSPLVQPALEFINVNNGASVQNFVALIPTNGVDAIASNQWYHVAVTYNGSANTASNLLIYWTLVATNRPAAGAISARQMTLPLNAGAVDLCVGNTGRTTPNNNFIGLVDEVRISSVARATNEFIFQNISVTASSTQPATTNYPSNTLDGNLNSRWSAQGDGQFITYDLGRIQLVQSIDLAFYQPAAAIRTNWFDVLLSSDNAAWRPMLTNKVGTNAALANFDFTDWPARYVRVVGHTNSVNDFNSLTETVIHYSAVADTDGDGLPDVWEMFYFGNLTNTAAGDPDGDAQSNAFEFLHGTDPTVFNASGDSDADGLPDAWEIAMFGNLSQGAAGDPDRDGVSNLAEYQNGCDPNNPNSVPGDANGNNLPDAWEIANLGGTNYWAYDDPDGDGYNNTAEFVAGTSPTNSAAHPSWISPRVALLRDSIVTNNACLMPTGSAYGRAINGVAFQTKILHMFNGYQYTAWYDNTGTPSVSTQTVWLARRTISAMSVGAWEKFNTGSRWVNGKASWDAHNVIALGISPVDGTLHFSWDHHGNTLRYRRSVPGLCTTNTAAWGNVNMMNAEQNWLVNSATTVTSVTYPRFYNTPSNGLVFTYRTGSTSAGDHWLHNYLPGAGNWSAPWKTDAKEGSYTGVLQNGVTGTSTSRNAYENGYDIGPDGTMHHTWTFREAADAANHDLCYAYSTNGGVTWLNNAGTVIANTSLGQSISVSSPGIIVKVLDSRQRLINQQGECVDNDGRVHVLALHRRVEPGYEWISSESGNQFSTAKTAYYHYFRDPVTRVWSQRRISPDVFPVGCRASLGFDAKGNLYGVFLSYPVGTDVVPGYRNGQLVIASASKASQYTDWEVVQALPNDLNGEPLIDQARLLADNILSVFIQDNSATTTVTGTPLHVFDFAVNVTQPNTLALNFVAQDSLVTLNALAGHNYQLQSAGTLSPANWTNASAVTPGINGLLALPDPNGRSASQRFYRVVQDP